MTFEDLSNLFISIPCHSLEGFSKEYFFLNLTLSTIPLKIRLCRLPYSMAYKTILHFSHQKIKIKKISYMLRVRVDIVSTLTPYYCNIITGNDEYLCHKIQYILLKYDHHFQHLLRQYIAFLVL